MAHLPALLVAYLLGGLTLIPLVLVIFFGYSYLFLPRRPHETLTTQTEPLAFDDQTVQLTEKHFDRTHDPNVAASYFAVCREYVPGGVNGKPPERTTPAGEIIAAESPSVYQSMYRSIFDRNKTQVPTIEGGKPVKKARNVFYVVLRHGHLLLFDNSEQIEVRHVIALAHYTLDIYAGGEVIPEGELYIKRNCIRLVKKQETPLVGSRTMPFYLFSDNCSEKEDFYHALLHSQSGLVDVPSSAPVTQFFETEDMIKLVRALHVSEEHLQTRWLNALAGRLFLAIYKTSWIESFIRTKIEKKISRVSKPTFITSIGLQGIDMGNSAPTLTNPKLREMNVDGGLTLEADLKYTGNIKVVVSAIARLELGSRFKPRTLDLVLATVLKRLEGHVLLKIKPPPSNRIWITFETMPKLELSVEPVVSSRQITYSIILRAIESRVREVVGETLVFPNWDDLPFFETESQTYRGGIWQEVKAPTAASIIDAVLAQAANNIEEQFDAEILAPASPPANLSKDLSDGLPSRPLSAEADVGPAKALGSKDFSHATSANVTRTTSPTPPRVMRSQSFATAATPVVTNEDHIMSEPIKVKPRPVQQDAASRMKEISSRSHETSPVGTPPPLPARHQDKRKVSASTADLLDALDQAGLENGSALFNNRPIAGDQKVSASNDGYGSHDNQDQALPSSTSGQSPARPASLSSSTSDKKAVINQSLGSATAAAKKWGLGVLNRQSEWKRTVSAKQETRTAQKEPYGRGQPLPPPGTPLPNPEVSTWSATAMNSFKRKPVSLPPPKPPRPAGGLKLVDGSDNPTRNFDLTELDLPHYDVAGSPLDIDQNPSADLPNAHENLITEPAHSESKDAYADPAVVKEDVLDDEDDGYDAWLPTTVDDDTTDQAMPEGMRSRDDLNQQGCNLAKTGHELMDDRVRRPY